MKRKIALLLAFAMTLSMLPANLLAFSVNVANTTGSMWEGQGPATNVRHWGRGVIVATTNSASAALAVANSGASGAENDRFSEAPGTNLRRLNMAPDYFTGQATGITEAHFRATLNNAESWLFAYNKTENNRNVNLTGVRPALTARTVVDAPLRFGSTGSGMAQLPWLLISTENAHSRRQADGSYAAPHEAPVGDQVALLATANGGAGVTTSSALPVGRAATFEDVDITDLLALANSTIRRDGSQNFTSQDLLWGDVIWMHGINTPSADPLDAMFGAFFFNEPNIANGRTGWFLLVRSENVPRSTSEARGTYEGITIPIEYVTNSDTNGNPVYIDFQPNGGWPDPGNAARRTYLTDLSDSRFNISLQGDVRSFHRYGTVRVGDGIRIAEAAQGAFNDSAWFVEMDVVTPGFFWAGNTPQFNFDQRYSTGTHIATTNPAATNPNGVSTVANTVNSFGQSPVIEDIGNSSSSFNQDRRLSFPVQLAGATNAERLNNDWFQAGKEEGKGNGLFIGADDRARPGDVEVEVRLYRATRETSDSSSVNNWQWNHAVTAWDGTDPIFQWNDGVSYIWTNSSASPSTGILKAANSNAGMTANGRPSVQSGTTLNGNVVSNIIYVWENSSAASHIAEFHFDAWTTDTIGSSGRWTRSTDIDDYVYKDTIVVANYGFVGLEFFMHEDDEAPELRSGMQEWEFNTDNLGNLGAIENLRAIDDHYHKTARAVLRETVAGSMPGTGASPITFTFNEGIEVLGVRFWTNDGHFSRQNPFVENEADGVGSNPRPGEVTHGYTREADNFFSTSLNRNSVVIRPEIGMDIERRWKMAEVVMEFYISVQAGFEHHFGDNEIEVTASANIDGFDWSEPVVIAYAWDPITISTTPVTVDDETNAAGGNMRTISLNDVTISEVESGALVPGTRIWLGVEGGISRGWNSADTLSISASGVRVVGDDYMTVSPIRNDSHGTFVEIDRASRDGGAQLVFENVQLSGRVMPGQETYNVFVAENAAAANWDGFNWLNGWVVGGNSSSGTGFSRGAVRGFFEHEAYYSELFNFDGSDAFIVGPETITGITPTVPVIPRSVTLWQHSTYNTSDGQLVSVPVFMTRFNPNSPPGQEFVTSFVAAIVVSDVLGLDWTWDGVGTATFSNGTTTLAITNGSSTAMVNGAPMQITSSGLVTDAFIEPANDRFMVPIAFFPQVFPNVTVDWNPVGPSITIASR